MECLKFLAKIFIDLFTKEITGYMKKFMKMLNCKRF